MKLGIGIIGAGGISNAHAGGYLQIPDEARIVAVADIIEEKAHTAAENWGAEYAFADYHKLLDLEEVDAVSVCTYSRAHCEPTVAALEAGKHVIVEKPMATTTAEAYQMVQAAEASGKILMVGMKWRFMPEIRAAKAFIESGKLGETYYAEAIGWQHRGIPGGTFIKKETAGGGAFMDNGVYTLDAVLYLMGHPKPITVSGTTANIFGHSPDGNWDANEFSVEDFGTGYVRFEEGITLFFAHTWAINFPEQWQMRIAGNRGAVEVFPINPSGKLRLTHGGYSDLQDVTPTELPAGSIDITYEIRQFVQAVREGLPSPIPGDTFLYTNVIFDGLYESSRLGQEVAVTLPWD